MTIDKTKLDAKKDKLVGKVQEKVGKLTGDEQAELSGKIKTGIGNVKEKFTEVQDKSAKQANDVIDDIKDKLDH